MYSILVPASLRCHFTAGIKFALPIHARLPALFVQLIQPFMDKVYCKGWGTIYVTDDMFDIGNPWDDPPTFWADLIEASKNIPTVESCGNDALKVLVPLLGSNPEGELLCVAMCYICPWNWS